MWSLYRFAEEQTAFVKMKMFKWREKKNQVSNLFSATLSVRSISIVEFITADWRCFKSDFCVPDTHPTQCH